MFENLKFGKTGFKTCVSEKLCISYSCILLIFFNAWRILCKKNHQPKLYVQQRIKNSPKETKQERERERESIHLFVRAKYGLNGRNENKYL